VVASSTKIREALAAGHVSGAARLLGRDWDVDGPVVHGAKRGRTIGVPTANIATAGTSLPVRPGIYAVTLSVEGGPPLPAVASLGTNPTFVNDGQLVLEVHVLDWEGDLYDRVVRCRFVEWIRPEARFESVENLVVQIRADISDARSALESRRIPT
jgi:riboflavin kinase/FMN adenylyltransferase